MNTQTPTVLLNGSVLEFHCMNNETKKRVLKSLRLGRPIRDARVIGDVEKIRQFVKQLDKMWGNDLHPTD